MNMLEFIKENFKAWNRKDEINIGNNRLYKVIGCGPHAFKVLKFGPNEETKKPTWSQTFWKYDNLSPTGEKVISKMYEKMSGQTTL